MQHVFLIGAKGLGTYGGYETFVNKLTEYHQNDKWIKYHVACKANGEGCIDETKLEGTVSLSKNEFIYHNAHCFKIRVPNIGAAKAIFYDIVALEKCCKIIKKQNIAQPIVYIMACRIGPFIKRYYDIIHGLDGKIYLNPDGHEWKRAKWNRPIRKYWKASEKRMVKYCDLVICDSCIIEQYIHEEYDGRGISGVNPVTTFIAYGAEVRKSRLLDNDIQLINWYREKKIEPKHYYLMVGRFVPENNYEIILREYMKSRSKYELVIITNVNDKYLKELEQKITFSADRRIRFVGTVYNQELLLKIRENAYGYLHGHEVGGTNPSLLEALGSTDLNLILDVDFNREVAGEAAFYWNKEDGNLATLIDRVEGLEFESIEAMGKKAKSRIEEAYSWDYICDKYARVFGK